MSDTNVQLVATDKDLEDEVDEKEFCRLIGDSADGRQKRQLAFDDILYQLRNRVPPIQEGDLAVITELKIAVVYGAIARLYRDNMTTGGGDDINHSKAKHYQAMYKERVHQLRPSVANQKTGGPSGIAFHRR